MSDYIYETTPYGTKRTPDGWYVEQTGWMKLIAGPFATKDEAEEESIQAARGAGVLRRIRIRSHKPA
jgi:hypothetical protein